ncbi:MAG: regulatory protein RecX [Microbacterium sp.]
MTDGPASWNNTWAGDIQPAGPLPDDVAERMASAEQALLKKLRSRSLSEREARSFLREQLLPAEGAEALIQAMCGRGYLDDARMAEQLIHTATTRKGLGRQAIDQSLVQRGIAREVIEAALADLPDDDADRALDFARTKARAMADLDHDVALRRLAGQLARRGYGSAALQAARQALDERAVAPAE